MFVVFIYEYKKIKMLSWSYMTKEISSAILRILPFVIIISVVTILKKKGKLSAEDTALQQPISMFSYLFCVIGFVFFSLLIEVVLNSFGLLEVAKWNHTLVSSIIRIMGAVVLAPIAEELIFRGILLSKLNRKFNKHLAIFLQAVFFVVLHNFTYQNTTSSNIGIVQTFVDASLFGYARFYTRSIYTSMTMHISGNLIATLERFIL